MRHGKLQSNRDFSLQGKWEPVPGCLINRYFRIKNLFDIYLIYISKLVTRLQGEIGGETNLATLSSYHMGICYFY